MHWFLAGSFAVFREPAKEQIIQTAIPWDSPREAGRIDATRLSAENHHFDQGMAGDLLKSTWLIQEWHCETLLPVPIKQQTTHTLGTIYRTKKNKPRVSLAMAVGFIVTAFLFLALPLTQLMSVFKQAGQPVETTDFSIQPPPPPPEKPPPPNEEEEEKEKPELETKPDPLTLAQLEIALNPGDGEASGDFGFGTFTANIDTLDEIDIFELSELDTKPRPRNRVAPVYPSELKRRGISGLAHVVFIVDTNGKVRSPRIESSSHRDFEKASLDAVLQWTFEPGIKDGKAVKTRMRLPLRYSLER